MKPNSIKLETVRRDFLMQLLIEYNNSILGLLDELDISLREVDSKHAIRLNTLLGTSQGLTLFIDHKNRCDKLEQTNVKEMEDMHDKIMSSQIEISELIEDMNLTDQAEFMKSFGFAFIGNKGD
tara:strand:- start:191 stop:562 length:372 start_codon:yes stop_codon:yes gene_type:complete